MVSLDLPTPPKSWMQLDGKMMEKIQELHIQSANDDDYKLKVFLMLTGLELIPDSLGNGDDGLPVYLVRRKGRSHRNEATELQVWEVKYWTDQFCPFLDSPFKAYHCPYPDGMVIGRKRFKAPDGLLTNVTYQQFSEVQRAMADYWTATDTLDKLYKKIDEWKNWKPVYGIDYKVSAKPKMNFERMAQRISDTNESIRNARNTFLAHILVPRRKVWLERLRVWLGETFKNLYVYNSEVAEQNISMMDEVDDKTFLVLYQQVQSALGYYKQSFPDIFRESKRKDKQGKNELVIECDTVEAVKKYAQYPLAQDVYDENAVLIFSVLNSMAKEAKMIEEQNAKLKKK